MAVEKPLSVLSLCMVMSLNSLSLPKSSRKMTPAAHVLIDSQRLAPTGHASSSFFRIAFQSFRIRVYCGILLWYSCSFDSDAFMICPYHNAFPLEPLLLSTSSPVALAPRQYVRILPPPKNSCVILYARPATKFPETRMAEDAYRLVSQ